MQALGPDLIYDWNEAAGAADRPARPAQVCDETLRDGLQSPSVRQPTAEEMVTLLHHMEGLGIEAANIGLPGAGATMAAHTTRLAREIRDERLSIQPHCAARTIIADLEPIRRIRDDVGIELEVGMFIGSSPIRMEVEGWDLEHLLETSARALRYCDQHALPVMFVTEDTTRTSPDALRALYGLALDHGARRLILCDTCGHATAAGVGAVVGHVRTVARERGLPDVPLDWHGHQDRGLGIHNALAAYRAGVDRLHGTALGVGERAGNTPMDLLLVNLKLFGYLEAERDLTGLPAYVLDAARALGVGVPRNYPVVGADAFQTGTGVHASAVIKALRRGDMDLANHVYSGVPAHTFGLEQVIRVGPLSGKSNVVWWLEHHGYRAEPERVHRLFAAAKASDRILDDDTLHALASRG